MTTPTSQAPAADIALEQMIQEKGLTAPRVTPAQIDALMDCVMYMTHHFEGTTTTVAVATLPDGFTVALGMSGCASPANFNAEIGRKAAIDQATARAREKLWELEGYLLKRSLATTSGSQVNAGREMLPALLKDMITLTAARGFTSFQPTVEKAAKAFRAGLVAFDDVSPGPEASF